MGSNILGRLQKGFFHYSDGGFHDFLALFFYYIWKCLDTKYDFNVHNITSTPTNPAAMDLEHDGE